MMVDRQGQHVGNYRLVRLIGEGAFAQVYLGEHLYLGTHAAIKILHASLTNDAIEPFRAEARMIARVEHPHIVRVLDFGVEGTVPFLVMSYAPHGTLRQRHPRGTRLPMETIISYVKQVASALHYGHEHRLIHRDVKPENMLVGRHGDILLSDFGIALVTQSSRYQRTQEVAGTVAYMAPEQIQGRPHPASDQYALGIVVYEWLTGERPFHGSFTEIAVQHAVAPPPPLHQKLPALFPEIERVVFTALMKDPRARFASIQTFADALEQACLPTQRVSFASAHRWPGRPASTIRVERHHEAASMAPSPNQPSPTVSAFPASTRHLSRRTALLGLAGLGTVGISLLWWVGSHSATSPSSMPISPQAAPPSPMPPSPTNPGPTSAPTTVATPGTILYVYHGHQGAVGAIAWSPPDGLRMASGSEDQTVQVWDVEDGAHMLTYRDHTGGVQSVGWSPDGTRIASGGNDQTVQVWDAASGTRLYTYRGHTDTVWAVAWSPGGKYLASASNDQTVQVWDAASGNLVYTYHGHAALVYAAAWSPDSTYLASASRDGTVQVWKATTGELVFTYKNHVGLVTSVAWSPDGTRIASGSHDQTIQVWDATTGNHAVIYTGHAAQVDAVSWSSDGTYLVSGSLDRTARVWEVASTTTSLLYRGHSDVVWNVAWSPVGTRVASASKDRTVQIWLAV